MINKYNFSGLVTVGLTVHLFEDVNEMSEFIKLHYQQGTLDHIMFFDEVVAHKKVNQETKATFATFGDR
jgi:hypothetical protein